MFSKLRAAAIAAVAIGVLTFTAAPAAFAATVSTAKTTSATKTAARPATPVPTAQITAPVTTATGQAVGTLTGTFTPTLFSAVDGVLNVTGTLTGTMPNASGVPTQVTQTVTLPAATDPSCPVLSLTLGPLNLDLLGLVVTLSQVNLNIIAQSGPGNLLGNLLCAVANLLNGSGSTTALSNLLNLLNGLLGSL